MFFYETGCGHCETAIAELKSHNKELTAKGFKIIAIASDVDAEGFKETASTFPWATTYCDLKGFSGVNFISLPKIFYTKTAKLCKNLSFINWKNQVFSNLFRLLICILMVIFCWENHRGHLKSYWKPSMRISKISYSSTTVVLKKSQNWKVSTSLINLVGLKQSNKLSQACQTSFSKLDRFQIKHAQNLYCCKRLFCYFFLETPKISQNFSSSLKENLMNSKILKTYQT